jgi:hypothetical protein
VLQIVTGDKTLFHHFEPERKQQLMEWQHDMPKEKETQECAVSWKNHSYSLLR